MSPEDTESREADLKEEAAEFRSSNKQIKETSDLLSRSSNPRGDKIRNVRNKNRNVYI